MEKDGNKQKEAGKAQIKKESHYLPSYVGIGPYSITQSTGLNRTRIKIIMRFTVD